MSVLVIMPEQFGPGQCSFSGLGGYVKRFFFFKGRGVDIKRKGKKNPSWISRLLYDVSHEIEA